MSDVHHDDRELLDELRLRVEKLEREDSERLAFDDQLLLRVERLENSVNDLARRLHTLIDYFYRLRDQFDTAFEKIIADIEPPK